MYENSNAVSSNTANAGIIKTLMFNRARMEEINACAFALRAVIEGPMNEVSCKENNPTKMPECMLDEVALQSKILGDILEKLFVINEKLQA